MNRAVFDLELRRSRGLIGWLALVLLLYGAVMALMYPILKENSALLDDYVKILPQAFLQAFGMEGRSPIRGSSSRRMSAHGCGRSSPALAGS